MVGWNKKPSSRPAVLFLSVLLLAVVANRPGASSHGAGWEGAPCRQEESGASSFAG